MSEDLLNISLAQEQEIDLKQKLKFYVLDLLARREYSQYELRQKLIAKDYPMVLINNVLTELRQQDIQSDLRCAKMLLDHGYKNKWGPNKIVHHMRQKKIQEEIINKIMKPDSFELEASNSCLSVEQLKDLLGKPIVSNNLSEIKFSNQDWCDQAMALALKKFGLDFFDTIKNDLKNKVKLQRFLYNKGFKPEHINFVIQFYNSKT